MTTTQRGKFLKDSLWLLASTLLMGVSGIAINAVVTSLLGVAAFGVYSLGLRVYLFLGLISPWGINISVMKYTAELDDIRERSACLSSALRLTLICSLFVTILGWFIAPLFSALFDTGDLTTGLRSVLLGLIPFSLNKTYTGVLNGLRDIKGLSLFQALRWLLLIFFSVSLTWAFRNVSASLSAFLWTEVLLLPLLMLYCRRYRIPLDSSDRHPSEWNRRHFDFGVRTMLSTAVNDLYTYLDVFMIGVFMDKTAVGAYSFASDISKNLFLVSQIVGTNFNPIISRLWSQRDLASLKQAMRRLLRTTYLVYALLFPVSILGYIAFLKYGIRDPAMGASILPFVILTTGVALCSGYQSFSAILMVTGYPGDRLRVTLVSLLFNAALNLALLPVWGIAGAALATTLAYIGTVISTNHYTKRRLDIDMFRL